MNDVKANLPYRLGVGIMLLNNEGKVFVGQRLDSKVEAWQMPQGGIDNNEDFDIAMERELLEEIGTNNISVIKKTDDYLYYDLPNELIPNVWNGKYRGQKQIWYLVRFEGQDSEINLNASNHPEFKEWQWLDPNNLENVIVPFKRDLYKQIIESFKDFFYSK